MKSLFSSQEAARADAQTLRSLGRRVDSLVALARADIPVPEWLLILPSAFAQCLNPWQLQALEGRRSSGDTAAMRELLARATLPAALAREIAQAAGALGVATGAASAGRWLVRLAADAGTDDPGAFGSEGAGIVVAAAEDVPDQTLALWRSALAENDGNPPAPPASAHRWEPPAVLVQRLAGPVRWGTAASVDPATGRRGFACVEEFPAESDAESHSANGPAPVVRCRVDRAERVTERIPLVPGGANGALPDADAVAAAGLARAASARFGEPQRILWSLAPDGKIAVLDTHPLPGLALLPDPDAPAEEWLRGPVSAIGAGAAGTVLPLTYSLARGHLVATARVLANALGVPGEQLAACERAGVLRRLVGQARGRLCVHAPSVRRLLDLLPDDGLARRCFEAAFVDPAQRPRALGGSADVPVRKTILALVSRSRRLAKLEKQFAASSEATLRPPQPPLETRRPDELLAAWHELETFVQCHWEAPVLNEYLALVCDGVLRELSARWCGDAALPNALLAGRSSERGDGVRPAEPAQRVREMAELLQNDDAIIDSFTDTDIASGGGPGLDAALAARPRLAVQFGEFLESFALLTPGEFCLETADLRADPQPLTRAVGHYARGFRRAPYEPPTRGPEEAIRRAEGIVQNTIGGQRWRRLTHRWLLAQTRARLLARESHARTAAQLVDRARAIFRTLGQRLRELGALERGDDIQFLTIEEIAGFIEGTAPGADLSSLVSARRRECDANERLPSPAGRFTTRGVFHRGNTFSVGAAAGSAETPPDAAAPAEAGGSEGGQRSASPWRGVPAFPGVTRGRARRVQDPRTAVFLQGEILVAERPEVAWTPLLAAAGGLVLEGGNPLARAAVVARDLGIPAVFQVAGIFAAVRDGEILELNGTTGTVTRVGEP